jgi:hypothetical protein
VLFELFFFVAAKSNLGSVIRRIKIMGVHAHLSFADHANSGHRLQRLRSQAEVAITNGEV